MSGADVIVFEDEARGTSESVPRAEVPASVAYVTVNGVSVPVARALKRQVAGRVIIDVFDAGGRLLQRSVGSPDR